MGQSSDSSKYKLQVNLDLYKNLTILAKSNGAEIIVFPEFGLIPEAFDKRSSLYDYAERLNYDATNITIPCNYPKDYSDRPIQFQISCIAKEQKIPILVNMVHWIDCDRSTDSNCPDDNHYQYNTDVIFDETGSLVTLYHKSHEFPGLLKAYDQYPFVTEVTYTTSFGIEFGIFICYDIMFEDPAKSLRHKGIEHFLYAVSQGQIGEKTIIEGWSGKNDAVLLSANLGSGTGDCSGIVNRGTPVDAKKYFLDNGLFPEENVLVGIVPTTSM